MPRYLIERTFQDGLALPAGTEGADACRDVVERNALDGVTWIHSYVSDDRRRTFCIYDGPSPEAIRKTARRNGLPVNTITAVRVLDEATSSIDVATEGRVQRGLARLLAGRTSLVIAHRLSTIQGADRVVVLEAGRVVEQGSPAELRAAGGPYAQLEAESERVA